MSYFEVLRDKGTMHLKVTLYCVVSLLFGVYRALWLS